MNKEINVKLKVPNGLNIIGTVQCNYRKDPSEYQIPHMAPGTKTEIPGPHYEIDVSSLLYKILPMKSMESFIKDRIDNSKEEKKRREELVRGLHIEIGNDLHPYICFPDLPENKLILATRMWLVHQALYTEGINFGYFEGYIMHNNPEFEDWLQHGKYMQYVSEEKKAFLRIKESLFRSIRESYYKEAEDTYSADMVVKIVSRITGISVSAKLE